MLSITTIIVIITCIISISAFSREKIINDLIFYPPAVSKQGQWYRFFTCGLIHGDFLHLGFNMFALYSFGNFVEQAFAAYFQGPSKILYILLYITALAASLLPTYNKHKDNPAYRSLGASGAVSAVIFAGLLLVPDLPVSIMFIPISIPGFIFAPLFLLVSAWFGRKENTSINHSAHIWGALYGLAFTLVAGYASGFDVLGNFIGGVQRYFQQG